MSYYTERYLKWGKEDKWGEEVTTPEDYFNYLLRTEATTTENKAEEAVICGGRDLRSRCWLHREVVGVYEFQPITGRIFEFILGSVSPNVTVQPYRHTIDPSTIVPSMTLERVIRQPLEGMKYIGVKIDTAELTIEQQEDVTMVCNWAGKNAKQTSPGWTIPTIDFAIEPYSFYHATMQYGTITMENVTRCIITINNNLTPRYSASEGEYTCVEIREGALEVTGRISVGKDIRIYVEDLLSRGGENCTIKLAKTGHTMEIRLNDISFDEYADVLTGIEPYEVEFPFVARRTATGPAIRVVTTGTEGTFSKYVP